MSEVHLRRYPVAMLTFWSEWDLWRCLYCGGPFEEVDHVLASSQGGSNAPANLVPSCWSCNHGPGGKFARDVGSWTVM